MAQQGQAQPIEDRHSVLRIGSTYQEQAQRIGDMHSVSREGAAYQGLARGTENQESHNPLPKGQNMAAVQVYRVSKHLLALEYLVMPTQSNFIYMSEP